MSWSVLVHTYIIRIKIESIQKQYRYIIRTHPVTNTRRPLSIARAYVGWLPIERRSRIGVPRAFMVSASIGCVTKQAMVGCDC